MNCANCGQPLTTVFASINDGDKGYCETCMKKRGKDTNGMKKIMVSYTGEQTIVDFGLYPADKKIKVSATQWKEYVLLREKYELLHGELMNLIPPKDVARLEYEQNQKGRPAP